MINYKAHFKVFKQTVESRVPLMFGGILFPTAPLGLPDLGDQEEQVARSAIT